MAILAGCLLDFCVVVQQASKREEGGGLGFVSNQSARRPAGAQRRHLAIFSLLFCFIRLMTGVIMDSEKSHSGDVLISTSESSSLVICVCPDGAGCFD